MGTTLHVVPPFVVFSRSALSPAIQPVSALVNQTVFNERAVPGESVSHEVPPLRVLRISPRSPTTHPSEPFRKKSDLMFFIVLTGWRNQIPPWFIVLRIVP